MKTAHSKKNASGEGEAKKRLEWVALVVKGESNPVNTKHCITLVQYWTNVEDVESTLYKCYANVLCLLGK